MSSRSNTFKPLSLLVLSASRVYQDVVNYLQTKNMNRTQYVFPSTKQYLSLAKLLTQLSQRNPANGLYCRCYFCGEHMWHRRVYNTRPNIKHRQDQDNPSGFFDTQVFCHRCNQGYVSDHPNATANSVHIQYWDHHDQLTHSSGRVPI